MKLLNELRYYVDDTLETPPPRRDLNPDRDTSFDYSDMDVNLFADMDDPESIGQQISYGGDDDLDIDANLFFGTDDNSIPTSSVPSYNDSTDSADSDDEFNFDFNFDSNEDEIDDEIENTSELTNTDAESPSDVDVDTSLFSDDKQSEDDGDGGQDNTVNNFQGNIRTVKGAYLVYKRQTPDGDYEELWVNTPKSTDLKNTFNIRRAILAGTDIDPSSQYSDDGMQRATTHTVGNVQFINVTGLPN